MAALKRIAVLGSTGSIGQQTLDVVALHPDRFQVTALACQRATREILGQALRFRPARVGLGHEEAAAEVAKELAAEGIEVLGGRDALVQCALAGDTDIVVAAVSGIAGLPAVWAAVQAGRTVALANKEPLVVAGHLISVEAQRTGAQLLPVDSEHSAIFQALLGQDRSAVRRVLLTASGGAFRDLPPEALEQVTPAQALAHPTWSMGPKVTVDSATLMNKGFELIEAHWLFGLSPDQLGVLLHPESIVHSLVEFVDGCMVAQLAIPDMRLPIQYALSYPARLPRPDPLLDLAALGALHFAPLDQARWPIVGLARRVLESGGTAGAAINAADEVAVAWFLAGKISFARIPDLLVDVLDRHEISVGESIEALLTVDRDVRDWLERDQARWTGR